VANLITSARADRVLTMDLHAPQIQGFFDIPLDHLYSSPLFIEYFKRKKIPNLTVASPDVGGIKMARSFAKRLNAELILIDKRRPEPNQAEVMNIIGDAEGRNILIVDDLIDTAGTFANACKALKDAGAEKIYGACTHPILSGTAMDRLDKVPLENLVVTDTIPVSHPHDKVVVRSAGRLFAEAIVRTHRDESISSLFDVDKGN
jgi:ribose-phosphate pyrophosphokinase